MKRIIIFLLSILLLAGCSSNKEEEIYRSVSDLEGKSIGILTGSHHAQYAENNIKNADIKYLNTSSECLLALTSNKTDAFLIDEPIAILLVNQNEGIDYFKIEGTYIESGFIFSKEGPLLNDFNEFIAKSRENGFLEEMENKWVFNPNALSNKTEEYNYEITKGTINVVTANDTPPFCFISNDKVEGYSLDVLYRFANDYGYGLNISPTTFDALLSGVTSGKYDMGVDEITITEERKKNMIFSDYLHKTAIGVVYRSIAPINVLAYTDINQLDGKKIGCMSGSIFDETIKNKFPNSETVYFNSRAELLMGLKQGKIEAYLADEPVASVFENDNEDIGIINDNLQDIEYGICFSKEATSLKEEFNLFLKEAKEDGYLNKIRNKWFSGNAVNEEIEDIKLTGEKGTIKACTTTDAAPFAFYKDNKYQGYEVDLLYEFANRNGYDLKIDGTSFDALLSAVASNKFDISFNGIYITDERAKSVDFSDPDYTSTTVTVVRKEAPKKESFIDSIKNKIYRTFVEEDRYLLIFNGILTTLLITACSILFGTALGFACFLLARKFKGVVKKIIDAIAYVIAGLPVVVILMILFYIVFAKSSLSGIIISIIGFSLIVGLSVYGMLKTGVDAIDIGQYEGALALGYTDNQALFKFILPQAFRIIMPSYRTEIISLIKSSSIVGYVTVQDLTRVSDIIRSRTYDAFFPLIVTAVIYFILAWLLTKLANYLQKRFLPNQKTKDEILKSLGQKK